jgi:hypothetical protein
MNPTPAKTDKTGRSASRLIEKAVVALLTKSTIKAAAREIGKSPRTLQRLMATPEFEAAYSAAKTGLIRAATNILSSNAGSAAAVLRKIFSDRKATDAARVSAAVSTVRLCLEGFEMEVLEQRITALERREHETF